MIFSPKFTISYQTGWLAWRLLLLLALLRLPLAGAARPNPAAALLAQALNPDGTLRPGLRGSFDARGFVLRTAPDGRPVFRPAGPAGTSGVGDERWQSGFGEPGTDDTVQAIVRMGPDLYLGGGFNSAGGISNECTANGVVKWTGSAWSSLGTGAANGVNGTVRALAVLGPDLYVAGNFSTAGGQPANGIARWNGTSWRSVGIGAANGVSGGGVLALAVVGTDLYVGGTFTQAGGLPASHLARWNGTAWSALGASTINGTNGPVVALAPAGVAGGVYVGGSFTLAGGGTANSVARWTGAGWVSLGTGAGNGVVGRVRALAVAGSDLYVGGRFNVGGNSTTSHLARWSGGTWTAMGPFSAGSTPAEVLSLAVVGTTLYVGGNFYQVGSLFAHHIVSWSGTSWSRLGHDTDSDNGTDDVVGALYAAGNDLYVGGYFYNAGNVRSNFVAKYNAAGWSCFTTGLNDFVYSVAVMGSDVYVGGLFTQAAGLSVNNIAKWNGTTWSALGMGPANGVQTNRLNGRRNGSVYVLAVVGSSLYVGGAFTQAGSVAALNVARWDGSTWSALGAGLSGQVYALTGTGTSGGIYAGGSFTTAGGQPANKVARWNGTAWSTLSGAGASDGVPYGTVNALAVIGSDVYVGGAFAQAGGLVAHNLVRWNGKTWSTLGAGPTNGVHLLNAAGGEVKSLAVVGSYLYVGGSFDQAGDLPVSSLARWNGTAWSGLGTANNIIANGCTALAAAGSDLYVGGDLYQASNSSLHSIAKWSGTGWSTLGTGLDAVPRSLAVGADGKVYAGGTFIRVGDLSKTVAFFGSYSPTAQLSTTSTRPLTAAGSLFPNPAHDAVTVLLPLGAPRMALALFDALGRAARRYPPPTPGTTEATLDLRGLPAGLYVLRGAGSPRRLVVE